MIRHAAAVAVTVCLSPAWLCAQTTVITVNTASADVYASPSTGGRIIGHTPRGTVLKVTRELGSWVEVPWPGVQDGVGFVHVSRGSLGRGFPSDPSQPAALPPARPSPEPAPLAPVAIRAEPPVPAERSAPVRLVYITPSTHLIGLGARVGGSTFGFGATARAWSHRRFGGQLEISRYALSSAEVPGRVTSTQFEPSLLYSLPDYVGDYIWVRPYLGSGVNLRHQTFSSATAGAGPSIAENKVGLHVFGGSEVTLAIVPQLALSVDLGYQSARASFSGVDLGGLGVSVSGHWYVK